MRFGLSKAVAALPAGDWALTGTLSPEEKTEAALGWLLAGYRFDRYRPGRKPLTPARLICPDGLDPARLIAMAEGEALTRDLINTPAQDMGPEELEAALVALAARFGASVTAIRGDDLLAQNFPMIHAVGRASPRAPRLLDMRWGSTGPTLTLVGKGVCFDTGGLNLKPSTGMNLMKKDMGGAATVMGLAQMIMALNLPLQLRVLIPAVENVIDGIRAPEKACLSLGARLAVIGSWGDWGNTPHGFVPLCHVRPVDHFAPDPVSVAESLLGTPYLWGGNSRTGIDCSGLVQLAFHACGRDCPGDSDMQMAMGRGLAPGEKSKRGDLMFWEGHVAMVVNDELLVHANGNTMSVAYESINDAISRISAAGGGLVQARQRF